MIDRKVSIQEGQGKCRRLGGQPHNSCMLSCPRNKGRRLRALFSWSGRGDGGYTAEGQAE